MGEETTTTDIADWRLEPISGADRDVVEQISLPPEQEVFAGSLDEVFGRLNERDAVGLEQGFAVVAPDETGVVGFFVLREGLRRPPWAPPGTVSLHSFRVRPGMQGQGVGRRCIALLEAWFARERPIQPQLMLAVNERNTAAIAAYRKIGFVDTGQRHEEGQGPQLVFVKPMA
ncbi:N-acetyltransferase [Phenylobacterium sp.]|uniref:GNAT family N-acetyltransferase n=1 Tax=Phenylobacterium sp. TaxID=1871053 RepID=UPI002732839D|nr:GNAT family N-acetyltransferase [Phenylobacterium sp.]MDP3855345.1 GNAT family N-acetyltransferase [Phenylobacterium sp.]